MCEDVPVEEGYRYAMLNFGSPDFTIQFAVRETWKDLFFRCQTNAVWGDWFKIKLIPRSEW